MILFCLPAFGQSDYMSDHQAKRLVLIVANSNYENLGELPGVKSDFDNMQRSFADLGFDIVESYANVRTWTDFQYDVLKPFRAKVERDDLVVVYFSGHGFTHAGYLYFAPTSLPDELTQGRIATTAIPVEGLVDTFAKEGAGAVLLIFDACRTAPPVIRDAGGAVIDKGEVSREAKYQAVNYLLALSVENGKPSLASVDPSRMSVYTKALVEQIGQPTDFRLLHDDVEYYVREATDFRQVPGTYDFTMTEIVLNKTAEWREGERQLWSSILAEGNRAKVKKFAAQKTLSPYVRSARKWLEDTPVSTASRSDLPPAFVDRVSRLDGDLFAIKSPISFSTSETYQRNTRYDLNKFVEQAGTDTSVNVDILQAWADYVGQQQDLGMARGTTIFDAPSSVSSQLDVSGSAITRPLNFAFAEAPSYVSVPSSETREVCSVMGITPTCTNVQMQTFQSIVDPDYVPRVWTQVQTPDVDGFLPIDTSNTSYSLELGSTYAEVNVSQANGAPRGLADITPVAEAIGRARAEAKQISWISIATPVTEDEISEATFDFLVSSIFKQLEDLGVDRAKMTSVSQVPELDVVAARVRVLVQ